MRVPTGNRQRSGVAAAVVMIMLGLCLTIRGSAMADRLVSFGDPLPELPPAQLVEFTAGQAEFVAAEEADEGLGPVFNDISCAACHSSPTIGGDSNIVETRFGRRMAHG